MNTLIVRRPVTSSGLESLHPLLRRIYLSRNIHALDELSRELKDLFSYALLSNIEKAVIRLAEALSKQQKVLIIGDFDVDGATSTALAVSALRAFGGRHIDYLVPNRFTYGYGLTPEIVKVGKAKNPDLIITVDNGISSNSGVATANELGIDVIITDHHLPGEHQPDAVAIVNPNQNGDTFPSKCIAGVGVIFYVMLALRAHLNRTQWFTKNQITCPNMAQYLDLVALGTVADVVPLDKNNRILVYQGLRRIQAGSIRPGLAALLQVAGKNHEKLRASDLGFSIGPRLNAAGRLDDMSLGIACLLSQDLTKALVMARQLDDLNKERRVIELRMKEEAFSIINSLQLDQVLPFGLCLFEENWHQGIVGLVAARVKEKVNRPVIAFAKVDDYLLKGSARSIAGLHIRNVLEAIAAKSPELISKFGGHAMAAGLSLEQEKLDAFRDAFDREVKKQLSDADLQGKVDSDGALSLSEFTLKIAELLRDAGPWGQGFPEPLFDGKFSLVSQRIVGQRHLKLVLQLPDSDLYIDAIAFNINLDEWPNHNCRIIKAAYRLDINEYNDRKRLQLIIEHLQVA